MKKYRVKPGSKVDLGRWNTDGTAGTDKEQAKKQTQTLLERLHELQEKLYATAERGLLIVLQGMDASGKDGTIEKVMGAINPQGCRVMSFKAPTENERAHDFLWRVHREVPAKRFIGIFNRSHYEDIVTARVSGFISDKIAKQRARHIVDFERLLHENGITVLKFFLHISKAEQKRRFEERIGDPTKRWKWRPEDLEPRARWTQYMRAYADAFSATSTEDAPWYVVPADHKWYRNLVVADAVVATLDAMKLEYPKEPKNVDWKRIRID